MKKPTDFAYHLTNFLTTHMAKDSIFDTMQPPCSGSFLCLEVAF